MTAMRLSARNSPASTAVASSYSKDFDSNIPEDTSKQKPRPIIPYGYTNTKKWWMRMSCCLLLLLTSLGGWWAGLEAELDFADSLMHQAGAGTMSMASAVDVVTGNNNRRVNPVTGKPYLDFIIAGFPKCGTTTLLVSFQKHAAISIGERENCLLARPIQQDDINIRQLDQSLAVLDDGTDKLRAMKCPDTLNNFKTIHRLSQHSPDCKFVIGVRHPVKMLQSFYNYRVTEIYDKHLSDPIPDLLDILMQPTSVPWKDVSADSGRFELKLMQFAKTNMTVPDLNKLMDRPHFAVKPNRFRIFLYALEQINDDSDGDRSAEFRQDLQSFLELPTRIQPFGHENLNRFVGSKAHKETVNICDAHFDSIRHILVENSRETALWIRDQFMTSQDVVVSNREYFTKILEDWMKDPCREKPATTHH
jgi:hypothetical protein